MSLRKIEQNQKQPKQSLVERYSEDVLKQAELRRLALNYKRLHVGQINNDRLEHMVKLLFQAHQNYYFGYFEASCTLAGSMLEQSLMILLEEKISEETSITVVKKERFSDVKYKTVDNIEEISQYSINDLIHTVNYYKMLPSEEYNLARTLQTIRNCVVHDMLPEFCINGENYDAFLKVAGNPNIKNVVSMKIEEVNRHTVGKTSIEMWAYFLLTRTRTLIEFLFKSRVEKLPPIF